MPVEPDPTPSGGGAAPSAAYGPDIPGESDLRLLGDVRGRRILDLGCGGGSAAVAFALLGATVVGVEPSAEALGMARALAEREEVRVELRQGDIAELAFLRADSVDGVFAAGALDRVEDLGRVLRQVHRVLKVGAPLAFSVQHPLWRMEAGDWGYFDRTATGDGHPRTISDLYTALLRASYRVDALLEPEPLPHAPRSGSWDHRMARIPRTLVVRARKEGS